MAISRFPFDDNTGFRLTDSSLDFTWAPSLIRSMSPPKRRLSCLLTIRTRRRRRSRKRPEVATAGLSGTPMDDAFDLYRLSGQRPAFEATGIEYARSFEKSPPAWGGAHTESTSKVANEGSSMLFRGICWQKIPLHLMRWVGSWRKAARCALTLQRSSN